MKLALETSVKRLDNYKKIGAKAFIFALKGFSSGYESTVTIEEIKRIIEDNKDLEIFISVNKNFFNDELEDLTEKLKTLDKLNINGILFYDMAVLSIHNKLNLKTPLVWNQTHMVTNYNTCNYYLKKGVSYAYISKEITLDEINEIKDKSDIKLFTFVLGYPLMSFTRRSLLTNYFKSIDKEPNSNSYKVTNEGEEYFISEEETGTSLYKGQIVNGSIYLKDLKTDYIVLNDSFIDEELFNKILKLFIKLTNKYDDKTVKEIDSLAGDYRGFFDTKTIYKVKK